MLYKFNRLLMLWNYVREMSDLYPRENKGNNKYSISVIQEGELENI